MGGGALLGALTPAGSMAAGKGRPPASFGKGDIGILNFALTLEYLEAAFYNEATANNKKKSFLKNTQAQVFLKTATADENAHVAFLKKALGSKAVAAPKVDFGGTTSVRSVVHQNRGRAGEHRRPRLLGPGAEHRQPRLRRGGALDPDGRGPARLGRRPAADATPANITPDGPFDTPLTAAEVLKAVEATGFLK